MDPWGGHFGDKSEDTVTPSPAGLHLSAGFFSESCESGVLSLPVGDGEQGEDSGRDDSSEEGELLFSSDRDDEEDFFKGCLLGDGDSNVTGISSNLDDSFNFPLEFVPFCEREQKVWSDLSRLLLFQSTDGKT